MFNAVSSSTRGAISPGYYTSPGLQPERILLTFLVVKTLSSIVIAPQREDSMKVRGIKWLEDATLLLIFSHPLTFFQLCNRDIQLNPSLFITHIITLQILNILTTPIVWAMRDFYWQLTPKTAASRPQAPATTSQAQLAMLQRQVVEQKAQISELKAKQLSPPPSPLFPIDPNCLDADVPSLATPPSPPVMDVEVDDQLHSLRRELRQTQEELASLSTENRRLQDQIKEKEALEAEKRAAEQRLRRLQAANERRLSQSPRPVSKEEQSDPQVSKRELQKLRREIKELQGLREQNGQLLQERDEIVAAKRAIEAQFRKLLLKHNVQTNENATLEDQLDWLAECLQEKRAAS